jgi:2-hydroxy-3-keto-5-methylthiopentenyl-1-phosphate phosphatase
MQTHTYQALLSSDWNECLAPCGPFDAIVRHYPQHEMDLGTVFRQYTGNAISLGEAVRRISALVPHHLSPAQMDAYLREAFRTYRGVAELMRWCHDHDVLFMINTTGMIGYFQRVLAKSYLPPLPALSANPMVRFDPSPNDPEQIFPLLETTDKPVHTAAVAARYAIAGERIFLMGDSGGDGPHFKWGAGVGAHLIGSMTKPSLQRYCQESGIVINHFVGHTYASAEPKAPDKEMAFDFIAIKDIIEPVLCS